MMHFSTHLIRIVEESHGLCVAMTLTVITLLLPRYASNMHPIAVHCVPEYHGSLLTLGAIEDELSSPESFVARSRRQQDSESGIVVRQTKALAVKMQTLRYLTDRTGSPAKNDMCIGKQREASLVCGVPTRMSEPVKVQRLVI